MLKSLVNNLFHMIICQRVVNYLRFSTEFYQIRKTQCL